MAMSTPADPDSHKAHSLCAKMGVDKAGREFRLLLRARRGALGGDLAGPPSSGGGPGEGVPPPPGERQKLREPLAGPSGRRAAATALRSTGGGA